MSCDESFSLHMLYATLSTGPEEMSRLINVVSLHILVRPGSTLSNLGDVRLTH